MLRVRSNVQDVLPDALTARDQWVCWRREERDGKTTKVPVEPATGDYASTTEPDTWSNFETAIEAVESADADGVGFVFTDDDPIVGIDLDDCRDPESGTIDEWARDVVTRLDSYSEVSPSRTGVHVIVEGELPNGRSRKGDVEMYETSRFFTVTGEHLDATPRTVERRVDAIRGVHADYVQESSGDVNGESRESATEPREVSVDLEDEELLERARSAENGDRFDALWRGQTSGYDSHSEADMALCLHLAFWTGGDRARMDALFRQSGLMREKWDAVHYADGATYGERTIERALGMVDEVYEPGGDAGADGTETPATQATSDTGSASSEADSPSPTDAGTTNEAVYLEERNRLLVEKVRRQQATIERKTARIDRLEEELEQAREQLALQEQLDGHQPVNPSPWARMSRWMPDR